jgi:hypothetical protein
VKGYRYDGCEVGIFSGEKNGIVCEALLISERSNSKSLDLRDFWILYFLADANYNFVGSLLHADAYPPHPLACFAKSHG